MYLKKESVNAWSNSDKVTWATIDTELESQITSQVLGRVSRVFDVSAWYDSNTTPKIILSVMAMIYAGRKFQELYGDDSLNSDYGTALITDAKNMLQNILDGDMDLFDDSGNQIDPIGNGLTSGGTVLFEPTESEPMFSVSMSF